MPPAAARRLRERYDIVDELGRGGMATVYLGYVRATGRSVAIKLMNPQHAANADAVRRFAREARTAAALHHPNIVDTIAIEELGASELAIVNAHVDGRTLREALRADGAFSLDRTLAVLRDVASALAYAHAQRVVHRDVKPANIFLEHHTGRALLADFGVARALDDDTHVTMAGFVVGTPAYMAPELIAGTEVDERADVYALGLLGWEMLTGRAPWQGETLYAVLHKQQHEALPDLAVLRPDTPAFLYRALSIALAKDPQSRWRDAGEFAAQLSPAPIAPVARARTTTASDATVRLARPMPPDDDQEVARVFDEIVRADFMRADTSLTMDTDDDAALDERHGDALETVPSNAPADWRDVARQVAAEAPRHETIHAPRTMILPRLRRHRRAVVSVTLTVAGAAALAVLLPALSRGTSRGRGVVDAQLDTLLARAAVAPSAARAAVATPVRRAAGNPVCSTPTSIAQRSCLFALVSRHEDSLTRAYGALIAVERSRSGQSEPSSVRALRAEERAWIAARDRACRARTHATEGPLWGVARAPCFAMWTDARTAELERRTAKLTQRRS